MSWSSWILNKNTDTILERLNLSRDQYVNALLKGDVLTFPQKDSNQKSSDSDKTISDIKTRPEDLTVDIEKENTTAPVLGNITHGVTSNKPIHIPKNKAESLMGLFGHITTNAKNAVRSYDSVIDSNNKVASFDAWQKRGEALTSWAEKIRKLGGLPSIQGSSWSAVFRIKHDDGGTTFHEWKHDDPKTWKLD